MYMYKWESILDNETDKVLWNFQIKTNDLTPDRRPELRDSQQKREMVV